MEEQQQVSTTKEPNFWVRGLYMLLMGLAFQVAAGILCLVAVTQFLFALFTDAPNQRLAALGQGLARYVQQLVEFLTFATEELPFPFNDWPS